MKYVMFYGVDDSVEFEPEPRDEFDRELGAWCEEPDQGEVRLRGRQLAPASAATTVRVGEGEAMVADGAFAETKEFIAGFDVLEGADLDEAVALVAQNPAARFDTVELRPVMEEVDR
jgi:hypothetical protein